MARQPLGGLGLLVFRGFTITLSRHTTVGRTPLDEGPARRRDLYLTTHTLITDRHPCPRRDFFIIIFPPVPLFPFDPFCTFKSLRPSSCHLCSVLVLILQTQHKHPCPRWDFFFCLSGVFPLWSIFVLFKSFRPSCHFTFQATVLTTNTTQTSMPPVGFESTIPVSERPKTHALDRTATGIGRFDPRTAQPVASRCTDWAIPAHVYWKGGDVNQGSGKGLCG
jgi:hypothetical protein